MSYYSEINKKHTFIFDKPARYSKNESNVEGRLWWIQDSGNWHQDINLQ